MTLYLGNRKVKLLLADGRTYNLNLSLKDVHSVSSQVVSALEKLFINTLENKTIAEVEG